jgi:hypothetical protein
MLLHLVRGLTMSAFLHFHIAAKLVYTSWFTPKADIN